MIKKLISKLLFCKDLPFKVNLIEYNPIGEENFTSASETMINQYKELLEKAKITVTVRRSRGKDIDAACGQLANK
jgi:23S rRNA (adenine2503-C2)-methyltransferase